MEKKFDKIGVKLCEGDKALTVDQAKELIGWQPESEGPQKGFGADYRLKDVDGNKVRLLNNTTNRPFRMGLAKRYANEVLRKKWMMNGESIVVDCMGKIQSGQHRLVGFILAEQTRKKAVDKWRDGYGWRSPITVEVLIVTGISNKAEVVDTLDLGQKRTLGDVVFRNQEFKGQTEREAKRLSNILAGATRLVWMRQGGVMVSDAPHFPHSEALDFIEDHPGLLDAVHFIFNEEGGTGADGKLVSNFLSLGYAAGLLYLMSASDTDPDKYQDKGPSAMKFGLQTKAQDFWVKFAQGAELKKGSPVLALRNILPRIDASGGMGRDEIVGTVVKTFNLWADGKTIKSARDIKVKKSKDDDGRIILAEDPRLGGIDTVVDIPVDDVDEAPPEAEAPKAPARGERKGKDWAKGDTGWVKDADGDNWFGTVTGLSDDGAMVFVKSIDTGDEWEVTTTDLVLNKPKA